MISKLLRDASFYAIVRRLSWVLASSALLGSGCGIAYRFGSPTLRRTILEALGEHGAPITYNVVGTIALIMLGAMVAIGGRTRLPVSPLRFIACYRPAEIALSAVAVFFGLWFGFAASLLPNAEAERTLLLSIVGFLFSAGMLMLPVWASFEGHGRWSAPGVRRYSAITSVVGVVVFYWTYLR